MNMKKIRLGDLLLQQGLVDEATLKRASEEQKKTGKKFGRTLIDMGALEEQALLDLLSEQLKIPFIDLNHFDLDLELVIQLPETYARRYRAIVLKSTTSGLLVGFADPLDLYALDEVQKILKQPVDLAIVAEADLLSTLDRVYRRTQEISSFAEELSGELAAEAEVENVFDELQASDDDAPVVKLLNSIFRDAIQANASDIHIEPGEHELHIRFRIDGVLTENLLDDKRIASALVQKLKLRANLDISERRLPQDGRFHLKLNQRAFDIRLSTMPTANGEVVVMRLLDQSKPITSLEKLGLSKKQAKLMSQFYTFPHGMILVTGPTGSGKTTTLYSLLAKLNKPQVKIITVEDPVEYRLARINQVQVNPKIGLDFARVLRSVLRQDPDVVMIGEIRDTETAQIALRAAITGHLVLATLHTNDAISAATRLIDMGCEPFMVAAAVRGVIAQRLVRLICQYCKVHYQANEHDIAWLTAFNHQIDSDNLVIGKGCSHCNYTGYQGRMGVYELLALSPKLLSALSQHDTLGFMESVKLEKDYEPLSEALLSLMHQGKTSVEEAMRVLGQIEEVADAGL